MEKKIWYYKLSVLSRKDEKRVTGSELKGIFDKLIKSKAKYHFKNDDVHSIKLPAALNDKGMPIFDGKCVILDIRSNTDGYLFGTLSNEKDHNTAQKRDNQNLSTSEIMDEDEINRVHFELFSYFMIHYDSGIISFIFTMGGPHIQQLSNLSNIFREYTIAVSAILYHDVLEKVNQSSYVNKITYTAAVPNVGLLGGFLLTDEELRELRDSELSEITITIKAKRNRSFLGNAFKNKIVDLVRRKELKNAEVSCKQSENEKYLEYNLFSEKFCHAITFDIDHLQNTKSVRNEIENSLILCFNEVSGTLMDYIKK